MLTCIRRIQGELSRVSERIETRIRAWRRGTRPNRKNNNFSWSRPVCQQHEAALPPTVVNADPFLRLEHADEMQRTCRATGTITIFAIENGPNNVKTAITARTKDEC